MTNPTCGRAAGIALVLALSHGCIDAAAYRCTGANACGVGVCEPTGYCSYPDESCASRRYSDLAGDGLAGTCVGSDASDDASSTEGSAQDSGGGSGNGPAVCGNGIVEPGEVCDDGDAVDGDGCNADCQASGSVQWELVIPGADGGRDTGWAVTVLGGGDVIAGGLVRVGGSDDMLLVRLRRADGAEQWTWTSGDDGEQDGGDDHIEALKINAIGQIVAGGIRPPPQGGDSAWIGVFDASGATVFDDHPPGDIVTGVTGNAAGFIVAGVAGGIEQTGFVASYHEGAQTPVWVAYSNASERDNYLAIDRIGNDEVFVVGGSGNTVIIDRINASAVERVAVLGGLGAGDDLGQGLVVDPASGDVIAAGYVSGAFAHDAWLARVTPTGAPVWDRTERAVELEVDEEFEAVALDTAGNIIAAGFRTVDAKQAWVRKYDPGGLLLWSRDFDRAGSSIARAVDVDAAGFVAIAGETTGEADGSFDFWVALLAP